jgi:hypothetical protein
MLRVGFEPTTPVFERAKTVHNLDPAATVSGIYLAITVNKLQMSFHTFGYSVY